ncbi:MAG: putative toxin-antitoxin system toxin component, PIN family [Pseudomonadota bacterium]
MLDTNVLMSGLFFSGKPFEILKAWRDGRVQIVLSSEIFDEYQRVAKILEARHPMVAAEPFLSLIAVSSEFIQAPSLPVQVCDDPDDDKFLACALAGKAKVIVTGDKHLLKMSGYRKISIVNPARFVAEYLKRPER